jgi:type II secretory pathway pseudopilin PulG
MIVIFLIGLIGSVIGYNMKGSMDEGKAFKTQQAISQMENIFELQIAKGADPEYVSLNVEHHLIDSGIVKSPKKLMKDGWGKKFDFIYDEATGVIKIVSEKYNEFMEKKDTYNVDDEE